uniref:OSJNBa0011F23.9 protein n=1 Tax=Oryza sativa subsp. japonica TaxID=39947 RepID=Q7XN83_ORYSJ|nr:OSJNBa0011F23.9 [Oryza sativa Japonica Group]
MEDTHDNQHTPTRSHNIQAYIRQDTPLDIDFRDRHGYSPTVSPDTVRRDESTISDLAGHGFEEEGYPVVDYESDLQTDMSTTVR